MSEALAAAKIRIALSKRGYRGFRNNVGAFRNQAGRLVKYGLEVGSADWIGIIPPWGIFLSVEFKAPGKKPRKNQVDWAEFVIRMGGVAVIADSVESCLEQIDRQLKEKQLA